MTDQELDQMATRMAEELGKVLRATGSTSRKEDRRAEGLEQAKRDLAKFMRTLDKGGKSVEEWDSNVSKAVGEIERLQEVFGELGGDSQELGVGIRALDSEVGKLNRARVFEVAGKNFGITIKSIGAAGMNLVKGLTGAFDDSNFGAGNAMMMTGIRAATTVLTTGMEAAGAALSFIPFIGDAIKNVSDTASKATSSASTLIQDSLAQVAALAETNLNTYITATRSGVVFTNGMDDLRDAATQTGMSMQNFSKGLAASSEQLASSGMSMGDATKRITAALAADGNRLSKRMLSLGFAYSEQVEVMAQVISDSAALGDNIAQNPARLNQATEAYAKNMVILAGLTGKDAKAKLAEARKISGQAAFFTKIDRMGYDNEAKLRIDTAIANLPDALKIAAQQLVGTGAISDQNSLILMSQSPAAAAMVDTLVTAINNREFSTDAGRDKVLVDQGKRNEQFMAELRSGRFDSINKAASLDPNAATRFSGFQGMLENAQGKTLDAARRTIADAGKLADAPNQPLVDAADASQKLAAKMEKMAMEKGVLDQYARAVEWSGKSTVKFANAMDTALNLLLGIGGGNDGGKDEGVEGISALEKMRATGLPPRTDTPMSTMDMLRKLYSGPNGAPKYERGGVANMPRAGGMAMLHGIEAVIPLPDGKNIPANLTLSSEILDILSASKQPQATTVVSSLDMQPLIDKLTEHGGLLRSQLESNRLLVTRMEDSIKVNKNILAATR